MPRSKAQVQADLNLDTLPDDEFMQLLAEVERVEALRGPPPVESGQDVLPILDAFSEALAEMEKGEPAPRAMERLRARLHSLSARS